MRKHDFKKGQDVNGAIFVKEYYRENNRRMGIFLCACGDPFEMRIDTAVSMKRAKCNKCTFQMRDNYIKEKGYKLQILT